MNLNHSHHHFSIYFNYSHHRKKQEQSIVLTRSIQDKNNYRQQQQPPSFKRKIFSCFDKFTFIFYFLLYLFCNRLCFKFKKFYRFNSSAKSSAILCVLILPLFLTTKTAHVLADNQLNQQLSNSNNLTQADEEIPIATSSKFKFKIFDCNEDLNEKNDYPQRRNYAKFNSELFYRELNMHETLISLYKSCFKEFIKMNLDDYDFDNYWKDNIIDKERERGFFCRRHEILEEILYRILNTKNDILNSDVLNRILYVCKSEVNLKSGSVKVNLLDKLFLLSSYEHDTCGNIFRNSMNRNHLLGDVLKANSKRQFKFQDKNNQAKSNKNIQQQQLNSISNAETTNLEFKYLLKNFVYSDQEQPHVNYISSTTNIDNHLTYNYVNSNNNNYSITENGNLAKRDINTSTLRSNSMLFLYNQSEIEEVDNCTLILLNTYLLAHKSTCENNDFVLSLNHYDCASNNFSVKSNCKLCQEAYAKWLCSSNIPYFENGRLAKPCQRFCFNVQNLCPFFRPMDDNFGAQPLFHCRNVVQVSEERPDGYEDDDENYEGDDINDDDKCYSQCSEEKKGEIISNDLDIVFKENLQPDSMNKNLSLIEAWFRIKSALSSYNEILFHINEQERKNFNMNARYSKTKECIFNSVSSSSSTSFRQESNLIIILVFILIKIYINEFR